MLWGVLPSPLAFAKWKPLGHHRPVEANPYFHPHYPECRNANQLPNRALGSSKADLSRLRCRHHLSTNQTNQNDAAQPWKLKPWKTHRTLARKRQHKQIQKWKMIWNGLQAAFIISIPASQHQHQHQSQHHQAASSTAARIEIYLRKTFVGRMQKL